MNLPDDGTEKKPDDIAVTEVSDSVLAELSNIFGTKKPEPTAQPDITPSVTLIHCSDHCLASQMSSISLMTTKVL